jgi:type VI protein secretion system component Hcp
MNCRSRTLGGLLAPYGGWNAAEAFSWSHDRSNDARLIGVTIVNRATKNCIIAAVLCILPAVAQADIFMLAQGVAGDVTTKGHEKWIRVASLDWETEALTSWTAGGGASVGKPNPHDIQLVLPSGTWSQHFARLITQGKSLPSVVFDAVASDGRPLYRMTVEGFFVTQYRLASLPANPLPEDHIEGVFKKVKIEYYVVSPTGVVTSTFVEWDIVLGKSFPVL